MAIAIIARKWKKALDLLHDYHFTQIQQILYTNSHIYK